MVTVLHEVKNLSVKAKNLTPAPQVYDLILDPSFVNRCEFLEFPKNKKPLLTSVNRGLNV